VFDSDGVMLHATGNISCCSSKKGKAVDVERVIQLSPIGVDMSVLLHAYAGLR
jgi:hypothetical protein